MSWEPCNCLGGRKKSSHCRERDEPAIHAGRLALGYPMWPWWCIRSTGVRLEMMYPTGEVWVAVNPSAVWAKRNAFWRLVTPPSSAFRPLNMIRNSGFDCLLILLLPKSSPSADEMRLHQWVLFFIQNLFEQVLNEGQAHCFSYVLR